MDGLQVVLDVSEFQSVAQLDQLLRSADGDDEIVGVYIKGTQGETYRNALARAFAQCCQKHNTPFGFYDYMTNDDASGQAGYFKAFLRTCPAPQLRQMVDCEGGYDKYAPGVQNFDAAFGGQSIVYAQLSNMTYYGSLGNPKWVAQYDSTAYYRPSMSEIENYRSLRFVLWQWTSNYMGLNQDASVLLAPLEAIKL